MSLDEGKALVREKLARELRGVYGGRGPLGDDDRLDRLPDWDEVDFADVAFRLQRVFRFKASLAEWKQFLGLDRERTPEEWERDCGSRLTVGALAGFVCEKLA